MREIIFDTETTGLDSRTDRIIEIAGVELVNRFPTGRTFHVYVNPQGREVSAEAREIHGIGNEDLADKPSFDAIAADFLAFVDGAHLIAHNAGFDVAFINAEFARLGHPPLAEANVVDTLAIARRKHPMGPNSLDALCRRYGIDNSRRTKHGALLDCELLAEVYIELIGGKQAALGLEIIERGIVEAAAATAVALVPPERPKPLEPRLTEADLAAHKALVAGLGDKALWAKYGT
jgi:DNA polymerase-3 subunit epsilon